MAFTSFMLVAKSLRVNSIGLALVASNSSIIAVNTTVLAQVFDDFGRLIVISSAFVFSLLPTIIIMVEMMSHSRRNVAIFETIGAQRRTITVVLLLGLIVVGLAGAVAGAVFGVLLTNVYAGLSTVSSAHLRVLGALQILSGVGYVIVACVGGIAVGVLFGVRFWWSKSN